MEMTELELAKLIKKQVTEGIAPYLKVERPEGETKTEDKPIFKTFGNFLQSVVRHDKALAEYCEKTLSMESDPAGGYLVPEKWLPGILKVASEDGIIRSRATVIPAGTPPDAELNIPLLNQTGAASHDMFSGVWFQWTNEGGAKPDKEPEFDNVKLAPEEYSASTVLTDKIIRNAPALEAFVKAIYSRAQVAFEDQHFLTGNGVNQPLGIINSPAYIQAVRTGAGAIVFADILLMLAQIIPGGKYEWVISRSAYAQIVNLVDGAGNSIFIGGDATKAISDRLMGYPIRWTFRVPALGVVGDISIVDASYYLIKDGFGPAFDTSKHVYFASNKTMLKMFANVDGQPWINGTITAEDGATEISPFVGLST
jgi:HK97 family phage major capsid protein